MSLFISFCTGVHFSPIERTLSRERLNETVERLGYQKVYLSHTTTISHWKYTCLYILYTVTPNFHLTFVW